MYLMSDVITLPDPQDKVKGIFYTNLHLFRHTIFMGIGDDDGICFTGVSYITELLHIYLQFPPNLSLFLFNPFLSC